MLKCTLIGCWAILNVFMGAVVAVADPLPLVKPLERFAFSGIGVVKTVGSKTVTVCSGTLVAQDLVVTSAHCLEKHKGLLQHVEFSAGVTGTRALATSGAAEIIRHPVWLYASGAGRYLYDVAVVRLARPIPDERVRSIRLHSNEVELPEHAAFLAYKAAEQMLLHGRFDCSLEQVTSNGLYSSDCSAIGGNSGGAVLARAEDEWQLAGVIVASNGRNGSAIVVEIDQWLRDHVEDALRREVKRSAKME